MSSTTPTNPRPDIQTAKTAYPGVSLNNVTTSPSTIRQAIQVAVAGIENNLLQPFTPNDVAPWAHSRAVLALLAYCYAYQIYSSSIAAGMAACDPYFPWPLWEPLPDARALRRFRMENREAVQRCLMAALKFQMEQMVLAGTSTKISVPQLAEEANRRIIMAALADNVELEGE